MIVWPPSSGLKRIKLSYIGECGHRLTRLGDWSRSKCAGSPGPAIVKTPPFLAPGSGAAIISADVAAAGAAARAALVAAGAVVGATPGALGAVGAPLHAASSAVPNVSPKAWINRRRLIGRLPEFMPLSCWA